MDCNFYFTTSAEKDIDEIIYYFINNLNAPYAAQRWMNKLMKSIEVICSFPESGLLINNAYIKNKKIRRILIGNYILFYIENDDKIYILRIIYAKRNMEDIIKKLNDYYLT